MKKRGDNGPPADTRASMTSDAISLAAGVGLYFALVYWLHPILFGVPVIARG